MNYETLGIYTEAKDEYEASKKQRVDKANAVCKKCDKMPLHFRMDYQNG